MWMWWRSAMYSWYTMLVCTRLVPKRRRSNSRYSSEKSLYAGDKHHPLVSSYIYIWSAFHSTVPAFGKDLYIPPWFESWLWHCELKIHRWSQWSRWLISAIKWKLAMKRVPEIVHICVTTLIYIYIYILYINLFIYSGLHTDQLSTLCNRKYIYALRSNLLTVRNHQHIGPGSQQITVVAVGGTRTSDGTWTHSEEDNKYILIFIIKIISSCHIYISRYGDLSWMVNYVPGGKYNCTCTIIHIII